MRAFKLSALGAAVIAATATTAAQASVDQLINDSTMNIKLRNAFFDQERKHIPLIADKTVDWHQWAQGVEANLESGYLYDMFGFDASFYGAMKLDSSVTNGYSALVNDELLRHTSNGKDTGYVKMGQAYLKAKAGNEDMNAYGKLGYMMLDTNLLASSTSRMTPSSYKGYYADANFYGLKVYGAYASEMSERTSQDYERFTNYAGEKIDYVATYGAAYEMDRMYVKAEQGLSNKYMKQDFLNAGYTFDINDSMSLLIDARYLKAKKDGKLWDGSPQNESFTKDAKLTNLNTALMVNKLTLSLSYTEVSAKAGEMYDYKMASNEYGDGAGTFWTSRQISDFNYGGEKVSQLGGKYDFADMGMDMDMEGFYTAATYTHGKLSGKYAAAFGYKKEEELDVELGYAFQHEALKGLSVKVENGYHKMYPRDSSVKTTTTNEFRAYVDYTVNVF